jgi:hypothetical protein
MICPWHSVVCTHSYARLETGSYEDGFGAMTTVQPEHLHEIKDKLGRCVGALQKVIKVSEIIQKKAADVIAAMPLAVTAKLGTQKNELDSMIQKGTMVMDDASFAMKFGKVKDYV